MSLNLMILSQLKRRNILIEQRLRACICTCTNLNQEKDGSSDKTTEDGNMAPLVGSPAIPKYIEKKKMISRAMQLYIEKRSKEDQFRMKNLKEMQLGERHLANIMGVDVNELGPGDVKRAIRYILPSGLYSKRARPKMEIPLNMIMRRKSESFSATGKPSHYLYYTLKPNYFELMHEMAMLFEEIRKEQAAFERLGKSFEPSTLEEVKQKEDFDRMVRQGVVSFNKLRSKFVNEKPSVSDKEKFENLLQRIVSLPLAYKRLAFFDRFPRQERKKDKHEEEWKGEVSMIENSIAIAEGTRKTIKAEVKLKANGKGEIRINDDNILYFDDIAHREAILFPLKFVGLLGKFDIEAKVSTSTIEGQDCSSAQAGALRLAIAKALQVFVSDEQVFRMERAGLLTRDPRMRERKKAGQQGARRKFTWKAR